MHFGKTPEGPRWPRGQKFTLSPAGLAAEEAYHAAVAGARGGGRTALEAALSAWATPHGIAAGDGMFLGELKGKPRGLADFGRALESAGVAAGDVRAAIDRLVKAGLAELVPLASQTQTQAPPPPPPRRW
jgi:hypothetical protein